jgi:hypothetical protein
MLALAAVDVSEQLMGPLPAGPAMQQPALNVQTLLLMQLLMLW